MRNALQSAPVSGRQLKAAPITHRVPQRRCRQPSGRLPSHAKVHVSSASSSRRDDQRLCQSTASKRQIQTASAGSAAISWSDDEPGMAPVQPVAEVGSKTEGASFLQVSSTGNRSYCASLTTVSAAYEQGQMRMDLVCL
jgi:hypothetical protein